MIILENSPLSKRILPIVILIALMMAIIPLKASHVLGGEITWDCIPSGTDAGKFIFKMKLYRACSGAGMPSSTAISNPLYSKYGGTSQITCPRVSQLDISPPCYNDSLSIDCSQGSSSRGSAIEEHLYVSSPVKINGIPDSAGSSFWWSSCCRPSSFLINTTGSGYYLRAIMFPLYDLPLQTYRSLGSSSNSGTCYDSSPEFVSRPAAIVCANQNVNYSHTSYDLNSDSLYYDWSVPMQSSSNPIIWKLGYNDTLQLPNRNIDTNNIGPFLNHNTGLITFNTNSPKGNYNIGVKVSSYREGQKVAETYRDIVIVIYDCNVGTSSNPIVNKSAPSIGIREANTIAFSPSFNGTYPVGSTIELDIKLEDLDSLPSWTNSLQSVELIVNGPAMSSLENNSVNCLLPPCAFLDSNNIAFNGSTFIDTSTLTARFEWNTSCLNLEKYNALTSGFKSKDFYFQILARDNWCAVPAEVFSSITITLIDTNSGISLPLDSLDASKGGGYISWLQYTGSGFNTYDIYRTYNLASPWTFVTSISNLGTTSFHDINARTDSASTFYLIKINNGLGCFIDYETKSILLDVTETQKSSQLYWNRPYINTITYNNGVYYIYRRDTLNTWNLIDSTSFGTESYLDSGVIYNKMMDYKIESKDAYGLYSISNIDSLRIDSVIPGISNNLVDQFKIYPNPASHVLTLEFENIKGEYYFHIIDLSGKVVYETRLKNQRTEIDISEIPSGLYFIKAENDSGDVFFKKIIKSE